MGPLFIVLQTALMLNRTTFIVLKFSILLFSRQIHPSIHFIPPSTWKIYVIELLQITATPSGVGATKHLLS
jgi:hypothetical protein